MRIPEEDLAAAIAPLRHVMRDSGADDASWAGHGSDGNSVASATAEAFLPRFRENRGEKGTLPFSELEKGNVPFSRPLLAHFGHVGDMVMLLPLIRALNERFRAPVDLLTAGGWTRPLLQPQPGVGTIHWIRSRNDPYWITPEQWRLVDALRRRGVGPVWVCDKAEHTKGR